MFSIAIALASFKTVVISIENHEFHISCHLTLPSTLPSTSPCKNDRLDSALFVRSRDPRAWPPLHSPIFLGAVLPSSHHLRLLLRFRSEYHLAQYPRPGRWAVYLGLHDVIQPLDAFGPCFFSHACSPRQGPEVGDRDAVFRPVGSVPQDDSSFP